MTIHNRTPRTANDKISIIIAAVAPPPPQVLDKERQPQFYPIKLMDFQYNLKKQVNSKQL